MGVFVLSSTLNFLDRNILAAVAPLVQGEFRTDDAGYGVLVSAFSLAYALASPVTGYLLDKIGLNRAAQALVTAWSAISLATAASRNFAQLMICRVLLGSGESGGIPAVAKMGASYLPPEERALGSALGQVGIAIGGALAPVLAAAVGVRYGWRKPFLVTGVLGLLWIPLWRFTAKRIQPAYAPGGTRADAGLMKDWRLWSVAAANVLWMGIYSLWINWTTIYMVRVQHLSLTETARYAWAPPVASNVGAFLGGWLALRWIRGGAEPIPARLRVILLSAIASLSTLAVPYAPNPLLATVAISVSFLAILAGSVNIYTIPLDLFGAERAGFAISALVFGYGLLQTVISPVIGIVVKTQGFGPVCWMVALPPLLAWGLLRGTVLPKGKAD